MRFRKKGDGGGFKFKRMLSVEWNSIVSVQSSGDIADGTEQRAYIFGQPQHSLIVNGLEFINYKFSNDLKLTTSNGRRSPIVCGSLFNSPDFTTEDLNLRTISSTGAWAPRLPPEEFLRLSIDALSADSIYEIKLVFAGSGRLKTSKQILLSPPDVSIDLYENEFIVVTGNFIAPSSTVDVQIGSGDTAPPFINALTLKNVGFSPRTTTTFFSAS